MFDAGAVETQKDATELEQGEMTCQSLMFFLTIRNAYAE